MALCHGCQLFPRTWLVCKLEVGFISTPFIFCIDKWHHFSLLQSADAFHTANDWRKEKHSFTLSALLCIAHALPLACKSARIMKKILFDRQWDFKYACSFHERWPLDGWNDDVIQPARDAVLHYYKVRVSIYPSTVLVLNHSTKLCLCILCSSAMQNHPTSKNTCVAIIYPSFYTFFSLYPSVDFPLGPIWYPFYTSCNHFLVRQS